MLRRPLNCRRGGKREGGGRGRRARRMCASNITTPAQLVWEKISNDTKRSLARSEFEQFHSVHSKRGMKLPQNQTHSARITVKGDRRPTRRGGGMAAGSVQRNCSRTMEATTAEKMGVIAISGDGRTPRRRTDLIPELTVDCLRAAAPGHVFRK